MSAPTPTAEQRNQLNRRSLHLAYATARYNLTEGVVNLTEGVVAVAACAAASSTALIGFGVDSPSSRCPRSS